MSGFSALEDFEGDHTEIVRQKQQAKAEKEEAAAAKAQKAKLRFEELKAKAGQGAWGDSDTEDDMFASPPVRCSLPSLPSLPVPSVLVAGLSPCAAKRPTSTVAAPADGAYEAAAGPCASWHPARRTAG